MLPEIKYFRKGEQTNPFEIKGNTMLVPENFEIRFVNQEGFFEIFEHPTKESDAGIICKIYIEERSKLHIQKQLESIGINDLYVSPTLDHLCKQVNKLIEN